jgi:hypothetical protein
MNKDYISSKELSKRYQRSLRTLERWVKNGKLPKPSFGGAGSVNMWAIEDIEKHEAGLSSNQDAA